jgi:hypothetical protein
MWKIGKWEKRNETNFTITSVQMKFRVKMEKSEFIIQLELKSVRYSNRIRNGTETGMSPMVLASWLGRT